MPMKEEILSYIKSKGFVFRETGDEINLQTCPFCHKGNWNHFYVNATSGQFVCHSGDCNARGSILTLKRFLGDVLPVKGFDDLLPKKIVKEDSDLLSNVEDAHKNLFLDIDALRYLSQRKFTREAINKFKIGVITENNQRWLWFPYLASGQVKNVKMRTLPPAPKGFKRIKGKESSLFNEDALSHDWPSIILTEGEADCIALWSQGFFNVIGVTMGAQGVNPVWIDQLDKYAKIYFAYDTDTAGRNGASKFASRLGIERCYDIALPLDVKDVNDFFIKGHTKEEFSKLMEHAKPFDVESVKSLGSVLQDAYLRFYNKEEEIGLDFPWPSLTRLAGKMQPGDLWVIASKPKVGKSTFSFNLLYQYSAAGIPCLLFELEMRPERMLPRLVSMHLRKEDVSSHEDIIKAYQEMREFPFYFAYGYRKLDWDTISDTIRMCIRRYGIRFIVFDNLHFLCRSKDHMNTEISIMSQNFKLLAEELAVPILLVARPRKTQGKEMQAEDLMWSADIEADCDGLIILHREEKRQEGMAIQEGVFEPEVKVKVNRIRYTGGGVTMLRFVDKEARVEEL